MAVGLVVFVEFIFVRLLVMRRPTWLVVMPVSGLVGRELPACAIDSTYSGVLVGTVGRLKIAVSWFSSTVCSGDRSDILLGSFLLAMVAMSCSAVVIRLLSLAMGSGTLDGSHVSVSAMRMWWVAGFHIL